jgi:hypothetical protein
MTSIKSQYPCLSDEECRHFDQDNLEIARLLKRGLLMPSSERIVRKSYARKIATAVQVAIEKQPSISKQRS